MERMLVYIANTNLEVTIACMHTYIPGKSMSLLYTYMYTRMVLTSKKLSPKPE